MRGEFHRPESVGVDNKDNHVMYNLLVFPKKYSYVPWPINAVSLVKQLVWLLDKLNYQSASFVHKKLPVSFF